jgi:hypothetical protein
MTEQSHREEMNAAIRAQRERRAVPRTVATSDEETPPQPTPEPEPKSLLARLLGK